MVVETGYGTTLTAKTNNHILTTGYFSSHTTLKIASIICLPVISWIGMLIDYCFFYSTPDEKLLADLGPTLFVTDLFKSNSRTFTEPTKPSAILKQISNLYHKFLISTGSI